MCNLKNIIMFSNWSDFIHFLDIKNYVIVLK